MITNNFIFKDLINKYSVLGKIMPICLTFCYIIKYLIIINRTFYNFYHNIRRFHTFFLDNESMTIKKSSYIIELGLDVIHIIKIILHFYYCYILFYYYTYVLSAFFLSYIYTNYELYYYYYFL